MSTDPGLAAPGSSTYSSNSMHVGDGTWDASRNSFLLPNIQGLNFATMRYNGMGNRFRALPEYHSLVIGHGVVAAITFLGIVPASILIARFYHRDAFLALRIHITLQIFTILLATVVLVLGYFAVGPERSLTNPHHGIGVAIYVLVLVQAIGGWLVHKIEKGKTRYYIPVKLMIHQWTGRSIALLALAQIPIGLTLYGSPKYLFVLYALVVAGYVVLYFVLTFQKYKRAAGGYDERGSYVSGMTDEHGRRRHSGRLGALTGAVAGGVGIAALRRRFSNRGRSERDDDPSMVGGHSRVDSASYLTGEKYSDDGAGKDHTWRNRILGGAAGIGALTVAKKYFGGRKKEREDVGSDVSHYRPPLGGPVTSSTMNVNRMDANYHGPTETDEERWRRVEEGEAAQAMAANSRSDLRPPRRRADSYGENSSEGGRHERTGVLEGLTGLAGVVGLGGWMERRRERKEQQRIDSQRQREREEERLYRTNEQQPLYPGDNAPRPGGVRFDPNLPGSAQHNQYDSMGVPGQGVPGPPPGPYAALPPPQNIPPPPMGGPPRSRVPSVIDNNNLPPPPPQHQGNLSSPGSGTLSPGRQQRGRPYPSNNGFDNSAVRSASGTLMPQNYSQPQIPQQPPPVASPPRAGRRSSNGTNPSDFSSLHTSPHSRAPTIDGQEQSPAVSVRVKQHPDGRHVTVQRLNSEEAARRRRMSQGQGQQDPRGNSADHTGGSNVNVSSPLRSPPYTRFNNEPGPAYQQQGPQQQQQQQNPQISELHLPATSQGPSQLSPSGMSGLGSSPGAVGGGGGAPSAGYQSSGEYEANRRRRRAERMGRQASGGAGQGKVDFT